MITLSVVRSELSRSRPSGPRQAWRIEYRCRIAAAPRGAITALLDQLRDLADDLSAVEESSGTWDHVRTEKHLEALGWRFAYQVPAKGVFRVVGAHAIPRF